MKEALFRFLKFISGCGFYRCFIVFPVFALFSFLFLYFLYYSFSVLAFPFDIDYGEGIHLYYAATLAGGKNIYKEIDTHPFIACNYPPIYPILSAFMVSIIGRSFFAGRLISFIASILTGVLIALLVNNETKNKSAAFFSFLAFFSSPYIMNWSVFFRVDMLALFFSLLGVYLFYIYKDTKKYLSIPIFLLAFYTKQSSIVAPTAVFLYLLMKNKKTAFYWFLSFLTSLAAIFIVADHFINGRFYLNLILYNLLPARFGEAMFMNFLFIFLGMVFIVNAVFMIFGVLYLRLNPSSFFSIYLFLSFISSILLSFKAGSSFNYFIELFAINSVVNSLFLEKAGFFSNLNNLISSRKGSVNIVLCFMLITQFSIIFIALQQPSFFLITTLPIRDSAEKINKYIASTGSPVLVEYNGYTLLNNKEVLIDFFLISQLEKRGLWNSSKLISDCNTRKFSIIIIFENMYRIPKLGECIQNHYKLLEELPYNDHIKAKIYTPNERHPHADL